MGLVCQTWLSEDFHEIRSLSVLIWGPKQPGGEAGFVCWTLLGFEWLGGAGILRLLES